MARAAAVVLCALALAACSDNPYVIGHVVDAGSTDECSTRYRGSLVCSGFEARALAADWDETVSEDAGAVERSTVRAHSGRAALRASSSAMMSVAVVAKDFPAVRSGELYLRLYAYVASGLPTRTINFLFVGDFAEPDPFVGVDFNLESGAVQVFSPQANPNRQTGSMMIPRDRWFCLRMSMVVADAGSVQVFLGDALALDATNIDTLPSDGVHELRAGVDWSSEQNDFFEIFIDDLVLDSSPVACR